MNRFVKKRLTRTRVYPVVNIVDARGNKSRFTKVLKNTIESGYLPVTEYTQEKNTGASTYPPPPPWVKEKNRIGKLRVRHINHCMSHEFKYAFTLTVPPSSALRYDGAELLRLVNEFLLQNPEQKFVIQLEVYPGSSKSKPAYHVHGMSTLPINLHAWGKQTSARKDNLYCEPLINQLCFAKYINKDLHLLPKKLHSIRSNVPQVKSYLYLDADGRIQYTNDTDLSATYKSLVAASTSKDDSSWNDDSSLVDITSVDDVSSSVDVPSSNGALLNIIGSLLCLREVEETSPVVHTAKNHKCHLSSSKIHWNTLINVILCHNPLSPGSKSPPEIRGPPFLIKNQFLQRQFILLSLLTMPSYIFSLFIPRSLLQISFLYILNKEREFLTEFSFSFCISLIQFYTFTSFRLIHLHHFVFIHHFLHHFFAIQQEDIRRYKT